MAAGDKIYIADKQTLDDVNSKVGQTGNTGGTASAGTIFGKLNAIISSIASFVANWTAARAAKVDNLDAKVSTRQSEQNAYDRYNILNNNTGVNNTASATGTLSQKLSHIIAEVSAKENDADATNRYYQLNTNTGVNNTASATGTLSQKLSHIINLFSTNKQKVLVSKAVTINIASAGTHTLVNVTGGGQFEFASTSNMGTSSAVPLTITVDGVPYVFENLPTYAYILQSLRNSGNIWTTLSNQSVIEEVGAMVRPVHFKNSLVITVTTQNDGARSFSANYAVYE